MIKRLYRYIIVIILSPYALAQEPKIDPITRVCFGLIPIIESAFKHQTQGMTQEQLKAPLPSREKLEASNPSSPQVLLGLQMLEVVEDIYSHNGLGLTSYGAYRAETCYRSHKSLPVHTSLEPVAKQLKACEELEKENAYQCGFKLAAPKNS